MIQRRSSKLYKKQHMEEGDICMTMRNIAPAKVWNENDSKRCHGFQRGAYARWCPKEVPTPGEVPTLGGVPKRCLCQVVP